MVKAKRELQSAHRRTQASQLNVYTEMIMKASENDNKTFHQLIQKQRKTDKSKCDIFFSNDLDINEQHEMMKSWRDCFSDLYTSNKVTILSRRN